MVVANRLTYFLKNSLMIFVGLLDTSKEIKYSNWVKYENFLDTHCLYMSVYDYKWNHDRCTAKKRFLCQTGLLTHICTFCTHFH